MSTIGNTQITITFICPADQVAEGERIFESHAKWMKETHHRSGELELLRFMNGKDSYPVPLVFINLDITT
ncbi:MAG: hypothetical protein WBA70_11800 [Thermodesulfobacteriota bacterium]